MTKAIRKSASPIVLFSIIAISVLGIATNIGARNNHTVFAQPTQYNNTSTKFKSFLDNLVTKKAHVGDIDIVYKIFGRGPPLLLIVGAGATMNAWDPTVLRTLSSNHTIIIFDNRGIGLTTSGNKNFTISQYANDTVGLLDTLQIRGSVDVLGYSLGSLIAQELTLMHPDKVNKLILYASSCGGKDAIPATPEVYTSLAKLANPNLNLTPIDQARIIENLLFPQEWKKEHPDYLSNIPKESLSPKTVQLQSQAVVNWKGTCDRLSNINQPTLVIVGTDDAFAPPANSMMITEKIPGAWLVQIKGAGHGLIYQYPDKFSRIVLTFLET